MKTEKEIVQEEDNFTFKIDRQKFIQFYYDDIEDRNTITDEVREQLDEGNKTAFISIDFLFEQLRYIPSSVIINADEVPETLKSEINSDGSFEVDELELKMKSFYDTSKKYVPDLTDFIEKYKPIVQHEQEEDVINHTDYMIDILDFNYDDTEIGKSYVKALSEKRLFTVLEAEGGTYISAGYHYVNREGYIITEIPYTDGEEEFEVTKSDITLTRKEAIYKCSEYALKHFDHRDLTLIFMKGYKGFNDFTNEELEQDLWYSFDQRHDIQEEGK